MKSADLGQTSPWREGENKHLFSRRRTIKHIATLAVFLCFCLGLSTGSTLVMPLDQVKPGMKGKGKSAFAGKTIEEFGVEILGVLENVLPKRNVILARLSGQGLENTGIVQGMSGSPVYIDGKLIGAIAYSFPFAREPIAGITPIGDMLAIGEQPKQPKTPGASLVPFRSSLSLHDLLAAYQNLFAPPASFYAQGRVMTPIGIPLLFGGFSPGVLDKAGTFLAGWGFSSVNMNAAGQSAGQLASPQPALREGDPVAAELVTGDLHMAALGTVTYVDGDKVLAFGHPFYNLGEVDIAMAQAHVLAIVPSLESSFKLATVGPHVGRFTQDRASGARGELGKMPRLVPLSLRLIGSGGKAKEFKVELVNDKLLTPLLMNMSVSSLLSSEERSLGDLSYVLEADVYLDNGLSVHLEDLFSGNLDAASTSLSGLLTAVVYFLTNNEFQPISIHRLDLNVRALEEARFSTLERVWLDKYEVSAGERIQVKIYCRAFGGRSVEEEVDIEAPLLPPGSEFQLLIGDAASMHQVEMVQYKSQDFVPRSLAQLIRILGNLRKNNRIYFKMMAAKPGLFLKGEEMPNLPPSMKSMFASPRAAGSAPTELARSTLREYQLPIPYVFRGMAVIPVKIKK